MVSLATVRAHNQSLRTLLPSPVAVFVGGTSGISHYTARELVLSTQTPRIYLIGRNATAAQDITNSLQTLNPNSQITFIQKDVSLLRSVDAACAEIAAKEKKVNLLFMTIGHLTLKGRSETAEGLDSKLSLHYYARMRFVQQLAPLLEAAGKDADPRANLSRVVSVYDPFIGKKNVPRFDDLSLKTNFSITQCATHGSAMQNFALERFAAKYPWTSFIHEQPGIVETGIAKSMLWKPVYFLARPWSVSPKESGERHLFEATAPRYASRSLAESGAVPDVAESGDGIKGSGAYHLSWDGNASGDSPKAAQMRSEGAVQKVWSHTEEVFEKICDEGGKY